MPACWRVEVEKSIVRLLALSVLDYHCQHEAIEKLTMWSAAQSDPMKQTSGTTHVDTHQLGTLSFQMGTIRQRAKTPTMVDEGND